MKIKRFQYEEGFVDLTSNGFGSLKITGVINHVPVDFVFDSAEAWYMCFEPDHMNLAYENTIEEQNRIRATILGVALMQVEEGGAR